MEGLMEESRGFKSIAKHVQESLIISSGGDVALKLSEMLDMSMQSHYLK